MPPPPPNSPLASPAAPPAIRAGNLESMTPPPDYVGNGLSRSSGQGLLFQLEALAVGALDLSGVGFVGTDLDAVQAAVVGILAVVGAVVHGALDALVGGAVAAAVGAVLHHGQRPPG